MPLQVLHPLVLHNAGALFRFQRFKHCGIASLCFPIANLLKFRVDTLCCATGFFDCSASCSKFLLLCADACLRAALPNRWLRVICLRLGLAFRFIGLRLFLVGFRPFGQLLFRLTGLAFGLVGVEFKIVVWC